jgi:hypothetical protein
MVGLMITPWFSAISQAATDEPTPPPAEEAGDFEKIDIDGDNKVFNDDFN